MNYLYDHETEESVISHIIGQPLRFDEVRNRLDADSFHSEPCKMLWKAIKWANDKGKTPDLAFLQGIFRERGRNADLDNLNRISQTPVSSDIAQQAELLEEYRKRRVFHDLRVELMQNEDRSSNELETILHDATERFERFSASSVLDKYDLIDHAAITIDKNTFSDNGKDNQILTGFRILDEAGGLPPETEVIIAAFSSQGKTAFALSVINNAMINGVNCAIYSAEMGKSSIIGRLLNMMGWNVPISTFKTRPLQQNTIVDFNKLSAEFIARSGNIYLDDSSNNNVDYICSSIRVLHRKNGIRLVMVDYLQIIALYDETASSDQEKLARASRKLQALAKQLNICILVLSQFSRPTHDQGHQPSEDLIRGSGQIYEACDIAIYVYRPEKWENEKYPFPFEDAKKEGTAMIKIGKYRDGESNVAEIVGFNGSMTLFYEFQPGAFDSDPKKNYPKSASLPSAEEKNKYEPFSSA